jgi:hypothetical protein
VDSGPRIIIQVPGGSEVERRLKAQPPSALATGEAVVESEPADASGYLEPPDAGEVVLSVPSPETLARERDEVRRVITEARPGIGPLVVVVEAAEELRDEELEAVVDAADHSRCLKRRVKPAPHPPVGPGFVTRLAGGSELEESRR